MKIYYAHSKKIYDTKVEKKQLKYLKNRFKEYNVICPNNDIGELGSIQPYLDVVSQCEMLICSEYNRKFYYIIICLFLTQSNRVQVLF